MVSITQGRGGGPAGSCVVCDGPLKARVADWSLHCARCGTWRSSLPVQINSRLAERIDVDARAVGLEGLRRGNAREVLAELGGVSLAGTRLLDVGAGFGWFVEEARALGIAACGAEPDEAVAAIALERGLDYRVGYFPDVVRADERFDLVTFNDVLEHIPDVRGVLRALHGVLVPGGRVAVNIPNARGLAYRAACALARARISGPYDRLWQRDLPSPHQHYFTPSALARLLEDSGFDVQRIRPLTSISRDGLWQRVHTLQGPRPISIAQYGALWGAAGVLNRPGASDIFLIVAARNGETP